MTAVPEPRPTCSGPVRETVGMVCQTCGTDYGTESDVAAMVKPLHTWLAHAGYGMTRLTAARKALDDFVTALTGSHGAAS